MQTDKNLRNFRRICDSIKNSRDHKYKIKTVTKINTPLFFSMRLIYVIKEYNFSLDKNIEKDQWALRLQRMRNLWLKSWIAPVYQYHIHFRLIDSPPPPPQIFFTDLCDLQRWTPGSSKMQKLQSVENPDFVPVSIFTRQTLYQRWQECYFHSAMLYFAWLYKETYFFSLRENKWQICTSIQFPFLGFEISTFSFENSLKNI